MIQAVEQLASKVGASRACRCLEVPRSTLYRSRRPKPPCPVRPRPKPARALSEEERQRVLDVLHSERFVDQAPTEVYASLLSQGVYLCSIRTMYRILSQHQEVRERRNQLRHPKYTPPRLVATGPNQVWTWDITKLKGPQPGVFYYLYVILDLYSRYVVGWMLAHRESGRLARRLIQETLEKERVVEDQLIIHSDRGAPMRSQTLVQFLGKLGITQSYSRPRVSDDNPFSESQFKTMKYRPGFPDQFRGYDHGLNWCIPFFSWYNYEHHHTGLALLTPAEVHSGRAEEVLSARHEVFMAMYQAHPERFVNGPPKRLRLPDEVWINPPADNPQPRVLQLTAYTNSQIELSQSR